MKELTPEEQGQEIVKRIKAGELRCRKQTLEVMVASGDAYNNTPEEDERLVGVVNAYFAAGGDYKGKEG